MPNENFIMFKRIELTAAQAAILEAEYLEAQEMGVPVFSPAQYLGFALQRLSGMKKQVEKASEDLAEAQADLAEAQANLAKAYASKPGPLALAEAIMACTHEELEDLPHIGAGSAFHLKSWAASVSNKDEG